MLEYDRIDISEGIGINKTNASKECDIFHYWCFTDIGFKYEPYPCNGCHSLMQKVMNFNDVAIVSIKRSDYRVHFWYMSKDAVIIIMNNSNLNEKMCCNFLSLLLCIKMSEYNSVEKIYYHKQQRCDTKQSKRLL